MELLVYASLCILPPELSLLNDTAQVVIVYKAPKQVVLQVIITRSL